MIKLHLGCGSKKIPGFINVDIRPEVNPDLVMDTSKTANTWNDEVDIIYSCHNLEHYEKDSIYAVLRQWFYSLKKGGKLYISVPDFEAICEHYIYHKNIKLLQGLLVGGGKNAYDHHYVVFDFKSLEEILLKAGFSSVEKYDRWQTEWAYIDDYSNATLDPPFSKHGKLMSLNVVAVK